MTNLFIFNTDFRVRDNPALFYAAENGESVVAMFIHNPKKWESHNESDLKIAFQIDNLKIISKKLDELNIPLKVIHAEGIVDEIKKIVEYVKNNNINEVFINKEYGINEINRDQNLEKEIANLKKKLNSFDTSVFLPESIKTQSDTFFKVFTPFSRAFRSKLFTKKIEILGLPKRQKKKTQESDQVENIYLNSIGTAIEWKHDIALNIFYKDEFKQINDSINQELKLVDIKDKMFFSHEIFIDYFAEDNAELDMQYGFGFNFGYQKNKLEFGHV